LKKLRKTKESYLAIFGIVNKLLIIKNCRMNPAYLIQARDEM